MILYFKAFLAKQSTFKVPKDDLNTFLLSLHDDTQDKQKSTPIVKSTYKTYNLVKLLPNQVLPHPQLGAS